VWPFVYYFYFEKDFGEFREFLGDNILLPAVYDPLTFLGLPKAWRGSMWNWIDVYMIVTSMLALSYGAHSLLDEDRAAYTTTVLLAFAGLFLKILNYMKMINLKCRCHIYISAREPRVDPFFVRVPAFPPPTHAHTCTHTYEAYSHQPQLTSRTYPPPPLTPQKNAVSAFIAVIETVVIDLKEFIVVMGTLVMAFAVILFFNNIGTDASEFGFHDDGQDSPFYPYTNMLQSMFLFAFVQDVDYDAYKLKNSNIAIYEAFVLAIGTCMLRWVSC